MRFYHPKLSGDEKKPGAALKWAEGMVAATTGAREVPPQHLKVGAVGFYLGLPTESNKWYSVVGVSGPILKSTTDITWGPGDRVSHPVRGRPGLWGTPSREGEE